MNLKNLLEETVQQYFETVNTICVELIVQVKNRLVYKIILDYPIAFRVECSQYEETYRLPKIT